VSHCCGIYSLMTFGFCTNIHNTKLLF